MKTLLLQDSSDSTIQLLIELAKKLGVKTSVLSNEELEDVEFGKLMAKERTGQYVSEEEVLKKLSQK